VAGEGNEEMAMGGVTVGNRTGMVGTGVESQAADGYIRRIEGRLEDSDGLGSTAWLF
jgi:hypothetical protein